MRHAEEVTFGGSGLDRAAEIRGDIGALAAAMQDARARTIPIWRGKPLVAGEGMMEAVRLPLDHPILGEAGGPPILLGREEGAAVFSHDISGWTPPDFDAEAQASFLDPSEYSHPSCPEARFAELRRIMTRLTPRDAELAATAKAVHGWHGSHRFCSRCGAESEMHQAGWTRICPACGGQHFPRTDPVVIMLITRGNRCLLGRSPGWPEGMYSCLAGFVEPGETIEAAVRREVWEEAGIRVGPVRYLASQPWAFPASLMFGCHGEATSDEITVDPAELEDAIWVTREEVAEAAAGLREGLLPARKGAIAHFMLLNWMADRLD
ncbi:MULTISPECIES: NAD(+) diphosphatase [Mameliella]|jgi:NAD+ diphosphatase|uniref:NAD(+) diphosphatase n=1 Tax=Mameliella alba TaxID=561184 RepID=A0A0B3S426_9RHOB|nr:MULTISPECIES: NAD(+) diphosphatase [Mameliella]ODM48797.1 NADH pyrophosphatase [Ruegeria sp. PBVC088]KHQ54997.1 NUDIX hydrolase [Mameliella alba]MBY6118715.1 NAD(+) diphosphatase [Mameliella alba]MDD9730598.1 NAD(+) diphosphatase [Mameliella sp. AT18]OWV43655.1 NADH pyrophosphatase [Mameliella alba]